MPNALLLHAWRCVGHGKRDGPLQAWRCVGRGKRDGPLQACAQTKIPGGLVFGVQLQHAGCVKNAAFVVSPHEAPVWKTKIIFFVSVQNLVIVFQGLVDTDAGDIDPGPANRCRYSKWCCDTNIPTVRTWGREKPWKVLTSYPCWDGRDAQKFATSSCSFSAPNTRRGTECRFPRSFRRARAGKSGCIGPSLGRFAAKVFL